jgi:hypothetical protein
MVEESIHFLSNIQDSDLVALRERKNEKSYRTFSVGISPPRTGIDADTRHGRITPQRQRVLAGFGLRQTG